MGIVWVLGLLAAATTLHAQTPADVSVKVTEEVAPAGSVVQIKLFLTEPRPIARTKVGLSWDESSIEDIFGISLGEGAVGTARYSGGRLTLDATVVSSAFGLNDDYPILTIAVKLKAGLAPGTRIPFSMDLGQSFFLNLLGQPYVKDFKDGGITISGALAVENVVPGGGPMRKGDRFRITGRGFSPNVVVRLAEDPKARIIGVSPGEITLQMENSGEFEGTRVTVDNKNGEKVIYYSYLRARRAAGGADPLDATLLPVFSKLYSKEAVLPRDGTTAARIFLAFRNPQRDAVIINIQALQITGSIAGAATLTLASGEFAVRSVQELFPPQVLANTSWLRVTSPLGINAHEVLVNPDGTQAVVAPLIVR